MDVFDSLECFAFVLVCLDIFMVLDSKKECSAMVADFANLPHSKNPFLTSYISAASFDSFPLFFIALDFTFYF